MAGVSPSFGGPCKQLSFDERLYQKVKLEFVEKVDPRLLLFYLDLKLADEERVQDSYRRDGRYEAASLLLRLLQQRSDWVDQLISALRQPNIDMPYLAEHIDRERGEVLMVVDVEMEDEDQMDVDPDPSVVPPETSEQHRLCIFKAMMDTMLKELVQTPDQLKKTLHHIAQLVDTLFVSAACGCLELTFRVKSLRSLSILRTLYQGGALQDALTKDLLTIAVRQRIHKEAAVHGFSFKKLSLTVKISDEDFIEIGRHLSSTESPRPASYWLARSDPVDPVGDPCESPTLHHRFEHLPASYKDFISAAYLLAEKSIIIKRNTPLCSMIRELIEQLQELLKPDASVIDDLMKIALNILVKANVNSQKNVSSVHIKSGEVDELVWEEMEKMYVLQNKKIPSQLLEPILSSSVKTLISTGWLLEISSGTDRYEVFDPVRRDYLVSFLLPQRFADLPLDLFFDKMVDPGGNLFQFGNIFLSFLICYEERKYALPSEAYYIVDVALFMSSVYASKKSTIVRDRLSGVLKGEMFSKLLTVHTSGDVDNYWHCWKDILTNLGCNRIDLISSEGTDKATFKAKTAMVRNILDVDKLNVIHLPASVADFGLRLALRSVALLDILSLVSCKRLKEKIEHQQASSSSSRASTQILRFVGTGPKPMLTVVSTCRYSGSTQKELDLGTETLQIPIRSYEPMTPDESTHRYSGSTQKELDLLSSSGILSLDENQSGYISGNGTHWSFTLDMSKYQFHGLDLSILSSFLPQLDHIVHFSFDNTNVDTLMIKQIIAAMNPNTVQGLCIAGCAIDMTEGTIGLSRLWRLTVLDLENTGIGDDSCNALVQEIEDLKNLKEFNIGCNSFTNRGLSILMPSLLLKANLIALRVHGNKLGETGAVLLSQVVFALKRLEKLSLWGCDLGDDGVAHLSRQFSFHRRLRRLSIRDNNLSSAGSSNLYRNLASCKNMQFIDTNETSINDADVAKTAGDRMLDMLKASSSWDYISLWECNIGHLSIFENPDDLVGLSGITYLCLQKNEMSDANIKYLCTCIAKHFKYLQHLNLRENQIGDEGAAALVDALRDKTFLAELWLDWNMFGYTGAMALVKLALVMPTMKNCYLSNSYQLAPPEKRALAWMVGKPTLKEELYVVRKDNLELQL